MLSLSSSCAHGLMASGHCRSKQMQMQPSKATNQGQPALPQQGGELKHQHAQLPRQEQEKEEATLQRAPSKYAATCSSKAALATGQQEERWRQPKSAESRRAARGQSLGGQVEQELPLKRAREGYILEKKHILPIQPQPNINKSEQRRQLLLQAVNKG